MGEGLCYPHGENKGADRLRGYREADLRLCFRMCKIRFSHDEAHMSTDPPPHNCIVFQDLN